MSSYPELNVLANEIGQKISSATRHIVGELFMATEAMIEQKDCAGCSARAIREIDHYRHIARMKATTRQRAIALQKIIAATPDYQDD